MKKVEFIESYIKINDCDYKWNDNHGELVRCKDCKNITVSPSGLLTCNGIFRTADWYCADGVRRDDE